MLLPEAAGWERLSDSGGIFCIFVSGWGKMKAPGNYSLIWYSKSTRVSF